MGSRVTSVTTRTMHLRNFMKARGEYLYPAKKEVCPKITKALPYISAKWFFTREGAESRYDMLSLAVVASIQGVDDSRTGFQQDNKRDTRRAGCVVPPGLRFK